MLSFLGRGSAFADEHNAAFFTDGQDLILLDCPATAFHKLKKMNLEAFRHIYILITHTHGDHSGGVGMMAQYAYFVLHNPVTVIAPSSAVLEDMRILLMQIEGCEKSWLRLVTAEEISKDWLVQPIPTHHTDTLKDKCFGWLLRINNYNVIYTEDTAELAPYLPYLQKGDYLYTEASVINSGVHLYLSELLPEFVQLTKQGVNVYLMHLDNELMVSEMIEGTAIQLAPLYTKSLQDNALTQ